MICLVCVLALPSKLCFCAFFFAASSRLNRYNRQLRAMSGYNIMSGGYIQVSWSQNVWPSYPSLARLPGLRPRGHDGRIELARELKVCCCCCCYCCYCCYCYPCYHCCCCCYCYYYYLPLPLLLLPTTPPNLPICSVRLSDYPLIYLSVLSVCLTSVLRQSSPQHVVQACIDGLSQGKISLHINPSQVPQISPRLQVTV